MNSALGETTEEILPRDERIKFLVDEIMNNLSNEVIEEIDSESVFGNNLWMSVWHCASKIFSKEDAIQTIERYYTEGNSLSTKRQDYTEAKIAELDVMIENSKKFDDLVGELQLPIQKEKLQSKLNK